MDSLTFLDRASRRRCAKISVMNSVKRLLPIVSIILISAIYGHSQESTTATATRAVNNKLIGLSNIEGLSDCPVSEFAGKVNKVKRNADTLHFRLLSKIKSGDETTKETHEVEIRLKRIAPGDQSALVRQLVRKGLVLRVAGYKCGGTETVTAFSVNRVY